MKSPLEVVPYSVTVTDSSNRGEWLEPNRVHQA